MKLLRQLKHPEGKRISLEYICPNALVRYLPKGIWIYCNELEEEHFDFMNPFIGSCRIKHCPMDDNGYTCFCYREEDIMKPVEARKFGDNYVSVDNIVEVNLGTAYIDNALYKYLGNKRKIVGRLVSFEDRCIVVDVSEQYQSKQLDLCYEHITEIKDVTKEMITP